MSGTDPQSGWSSRGHRVVLGFASVRIVTAHGLADEL